MCVTLNTPYIMALEIEHKYLVKDDSYIDMTSSHAEIAQGYLNRVPERTVRIRIAGEKAYLTVKGKNSGDVRLEFEYEIPLADAHQMLPLCEGVIEKTRYYVEYDGHRWEVDRFKGSLAPLVTAEIELPSSDTPYSLPPFIGENVTGNPRYYNSNLGAHS